MPAVARSPRSRAQPLSVGSAKLLRPVANGFVSNGDSALGLEFFDVPVTQAESKIKPSAMTDDLGRESTTVIQGFQWAHPVSKATALVNLTIPAQPSTDYMSVFGLPLRQPLAGPECPPHTLVNYEVCFRRLDRFAYPRHTKLVEWLRHKHG